MVLSGFLVTLAAVFFVVDPVGLIPIFLAITKGDDEDKMRRTSARACITACCVLIAFALGGNVVFQMLGITLGAFRVAGGLLLLLTALDMLRARPAGTRTSPSEESEGETKEDVAIVPLAVPLLAGPGAIATVMVFAARGHGFAPLLEVLAAVGLTLLGSYWVLRAAPRLQKLLGRSGIAILERVMGLLLTAVAVQFVADGTRALWQGASK
jgi:multiple antibiotic resistance protein